MNSTLEMNFFFPPVILREKEQINKLLKILREKQVKTDKEIHMNKHTGNSKE